MATRHFNSARLAILAICLFGPVPAIAPAEEADPWMGRRVLLERGTVLKDSEGTVDGEGPGNEPAPGKERHVFRLYRVERTEGPWMWLVAEKCGAPGIRRGGWARVDRVFPFYRAIDHLTAEIRANPGDAGLHDYRGETLFHYGMFDSAIMDFDEAIRLDPKDATVFCNRGTARRFKKEYDRAIADFDEAIRLDPANALALIERGVAWFSKGEYDKVIADCSEAIRLDPESAVAFDNRGAAWHSKKEYAKALADYDESIRLDPEYAHAFDNRGQLWQATKENDKALADYDEAIRLDPEYAPAFCNRGTVRWWRKEYDQALADFETMIRLDPANARAFRNRGLAWWSKEEFDWAIADFDEAIRLDPKDALAFINRGDAWRDKKDYNEAIRLDPKGYLPFFNRGVIALIQSHEGASADAEAGLEHHSWRGEYSLYLALLGHFGHRQMHRDAEARTLLDRAAEKGDTAAWPFPVIRYLRGDLAQKALLDAATDDDKRTEARTYLGLDLSLKGKPDEALPQLRWVQEHGNPTFMEYPIAVAELARIEGQAAEAAKP